mgnify:CR=1 FL=1
MNGEVIKYNNNRSFIKLFPKGYDTKINSYLKSQRINVAFADDDKIMELMTYCKNLLNYWLNNLFNADTKIPEYTHHPVSVPVL